MILGSIMRSEKLIPYRAILCRYNEINLKSEKYQQILLKILRGSIIQLCKREGLNLQSVNPLQGRLICFFPTNQISKAIKIFRYVIGIYTYSPVISCLRKFDAILNSVSQYFPLSEEKEQFYNLKIHSAVNFPQNSQEFLIDLENELKMMESTRDFKLVKKFDADNQIEIDIRKKGVYIFKDTYRSFLGGNPIESKNAFLIPWNLIEDNGRALFAALMLARRGSIITPLIFDYEPSPLSADNKIKKYFIEKNPTIFELMKYFPYDLPGVIIPCRELFDIVMETALPGWDQRIILLFLESKLWLEIMQISRKNAFLHYNNRNLHFKGVIFPFGISELKLYQNLIQNTQFFVTPLISISENNLATFLKYVLNPIKNIQLSLSKILENSTHLNNRSGTPNSTKNIHFKEVSPILSTFDRYPNYNYGNYVPSPKELEQWYSTNHFHKYILITLKKISYYSLTHKILGNI